MASTSRSTPPSSRHDPESLLVGHSKSWVYPTTAEDPFRSTPANFNPSEIGSHKFSSTSWTHRTASGMFRRWHEQSMQLIDQTITENLRDRSRVADEAFGSLLRGTSIKSAFEQEIKRLGHEVRKCISDRLSVNSHVDRDEVAVVEDIDLQCAGIEASQK